MKSNLRGAYSLLPLCLLLTACGGGGGGSATSTRTLIYTSSSDFETTEYSNQAGLAVVNSSDMYYRGHYRWYAQNGGTGGNPTSSDAGTGTGITVGVADSGINSAEASTGSQISINATASYNYVSNATGTASDDQGHGTHVAGIIASPKNASGMHGLAYNATIANFKIIDSTGTVTATEAELGDMFTRAYNNGVMIMNNSWGSSMKITDATAANLNAWYPNMIPSLQTYVGNGGVVVFAAGNDSFTEPSIQAGMPYRISNIEAGWLAVVSVDLDGSFSSTFSNQCGVAAAYCLAAPGRAIYSTYNNGSYANLSGTSMAAPHVSAAIAALKSMFPSLSYQQIRDRLLTTANDSGIYSDSTKFGQGLMDLDAASNPVGGLSLPTGSSVSGSIQSSGSGANLPQALVSAIGMSPYVLMVDNYQRAPFWISSGNVISSSRQVPMASNHLRKLGMSYSQATYRSEGMSYIRQPGDFEVGKGYVNGAAIGFSRGVGAENTLIRELGLSQIPTLNVSEVTASTFGYTTDVGRGKFGLLSTTKTGLEGLNATATSFHGMGGRNTLSIVAETPQFNKTRVSFNYSAARDFDRPGGIAGTGAFGIQSSRASGIGASVIHEHSEMTSIQFGAELNRFSQADADLLSVDSFKTLSLRGALKMRLEDESSISYSLHADIVKHGDVVLSLPVSVDEDGSISKEHYRFSAGDLLAKYGADVTYSTSLSKVSNLNLGVRVQRQGTLGATGTASIVYYRAF